MRPRDTERAKADRAPARTRPPCHGTAALFFPPPMLPSEQKAGVQRHVSIEAQTIKPRQAGRQAGRVVGRNRTCSFAAVTASFLADVVDSSKSHCTADQSCCVFSAAHGRSPDSSPLHFIHCYSSDIFLRQQGIVLVSDRNRFFTETPNTETGLVDKPKFGQNRMRNSPISARMESFRPKDSRICRNRMFRPK